MVINLSNAQNSPVGIVQLRFSTTPHYALSYCISTWTPFPTALPSETEKIWTISLTRSSENTRVLVFCNDKEVVNMILSDTTCSDSDWNTYWSKEVAKILFNSADKASDYYRPGK